MGVLAIIAVIVGPATLTARQSSLGVSGAPHSADPTREPFTRWVRVWLAAAAAVLTMLAVVVLLGWPR